MFNETNIDYSNKFSAFTDGSALNNKKDSFAGFAFYFPTTKTLISKGMIGTNNQAELEAMLQCLMFFTQNYINNDIPDNTLYIFSDSKYVIKSITGEYKGRLNLNKIEMCKMLIKEIEEKKINVKLIHVFAHTNKKDFISINNAIVDYTAREEATKMKKKQAEEKV